MGKLPYGRFRRKSFINVIGEYSPIFLFSHSQPASGFFAEFGGNSDSVEEFRKADILIDYQRLIRENYGDLNGSCNAIAFSGFQSFLEEYTECTSEEVRCSSRKMECNSDEKYGKIRL